jgi:hypothetical protein
MAIFCKLEHEDGTLADRRPFGASPGTSWNAGDVLHLGSERILRVVGELLVENLGGGPCAGACGRAAKLGSEGRAADEAVRRSPT